MPEGDPKTKFDDLQARIDRARGEPEPAAKSGSTAPPGGLAAALRLSTELLAGVVVGGGLGFFLDKALGTSPLCLIVFILVGFAAGTMNLIRAASRRGPDAGTPPQSGPRTGDGG